METSETGKRGSVVTVQDTAAPVVSIVVPAFNEAERIGSSLEKICSFVDKCGLVAEIIVVDDGSVDRTSEIAASFTRAGLRVVTNESNRGKGYSVRKGFLESKGTWVLFTDADLSAPIDELERILSVAEDGVEVVIGSRAIDRTKIVIHQPWLREFGGIVYNWMVQIILGLAIKDTQCGFKLFHRQQLTPIFKKQTIHRFGFDPELLFLARKQGLQIREVPVSWSHNEGSKVRFLGDGLRMFLDLFQIRWNWVTGKYR